MLHPLPLKERHVLVPSKIRKNRLENVLRTKRFRNVFKTFRGRFGGQELDIPIVTFDAESDSVVGLDDFET